MVPLMFVGCISLVEKTGQVLEGSAFAEKKIAVYRATKKAGAAADMEIRIVEDKAGVRSVIIIPGEFPEIKIRCTVLLNGNIGTASCEQGELYLTSLDYLGGNVHGWNEYRLELSGTGSLHLDEKTAVLSIQEEIATLQISSGRIRDFDSRITGNEALTRLRNRRERITVLVEWMKQQENVPENLNRKEFERYWKPVLFPEMVSKRKQSEGWQQEGDNWIRGLDIRWNSGYTERVFPETLWEIRNSGTLLRDWEEALAWIYLEHEWKRLMLMQLTLSA
jgi:hypothetical protein